MEGRFNKATGFTRSSKCYVLYANSSTVVCVVVGRTVVVVLTRPKGFMCDVFWIPT